MIEKYKQLLTDANECVNNNDYEGFLEYCTEDIKWTFVGETVLQGKAEIVQYMKDAYIKPPVNDVKHLVVENENLVAIGEITIFQEDGKSEKSGYCDFWQIKDGKLSELFAYVNKLK